MYHEKRSDTTGEETNIGGGGGEGNEEWRKLVGSWRVSRGWPFLRLFVLSPYSCFSFFFFCSFFFCLGCYSCRRQEGFRCLQFKIHGAFTRPPPAPNYHPILTYLPSRRENAFTQCQGKLEKPVPLYNSKHALVLINFFFVLVRFVLFQKVVLAWRASE